MNRRQLLVALAAGAGTALAGCASDGPGASTPTEESTTADEPTTTTDGDGDATVRVRETDEYGDILVDSEGMSLYMFDEDEGTESTCYGGCAQTWPPLTVEDAPTAGESVTAELGTTERDGGATQVTAGGYPLYYYAGDSDPGDTTGQGVGDIWWLLAPDGTRLTGTSTTQAETETMEAETTQPDVGTTAGTTTRTETTTESTETTTATAETTQPTTTETSTSDGGYY